MSWNGYRRVEQEKTKSMNEKPMQQALKYSAPGPEKEKQDNLVGLSNLILQNEEWLMERILQYAQERRYTDYASTLNEAWRLSICGVSRSLVAAIQKGGDMELIPDENYMADPVASFGMVEAKRHRDRGVDLAMFLGLMKYYRQTYLDLVRRGGFNEPYYDRCRRTVERFFDRVEIGFCTEWASTCDNQKIVEQQKAVLEEERLKVLLQLAGAMAHELNQPLMVLLGNIELMTGDTHFPERVKKYAARVEEAGERISSIVRKIQTIHRYDTKPYCGTTSIINFDQKIRVLFWLDPLWNVSPVRSALAGQEKIETIWAGSSQEALQILTCNQIDLVFLGQTLPDADAGEFMAAMNREGIDRPVIVLAGKEDEAVASQVIQAGAFDYLPFHMISTESLRQSVCNTLERFRLKKEIKTAREKMAQMSTRDDLTGLYNRSYFMKQLDREVERAKTHDSAPAVCIVNLDRFKQINDTYGHEAGNAVLSKVAKIVMACFTDLCVAARYRGEEFVVLVPGTRTHQAAPLCERFRKNLEDTGLEWNGKTLRITASIGIASYEGLSTTSAVELLKVANVALSEAKEEGRNKVVEYVRRQKDRATKLGQVLISEGYVTADELDAALSQQRLRLGEVFVQAGSITVEELSEALGVQKKESGKLGAILTGLGFITEEDLEWAMKKKKRKLGEIVRDNGLITDFELHRALVRQEYEVVSIHKRHLLRDTGVGRLV